MGSKITKDCMIDQTGVQYYTSSIYTMMEEYNFFSLRYTYYISWFC